jgi:hypothetical protein
MTAINQRSFTQMPVMSSISHHQAKTVCTYLLPGNKLLAVLLDRQGNKHQAALLDRFGATLVVREQECVDLTQPAKADDAMAKNSHKKRNQISALKPKNGTLLKIRVTATKVTLMLNACIGKR